MTIAYYRHISERALLERGTCWRGRRSLQLVGGAAEPWPWPWLGVVSMSRAMMVSSDNGASGGLAAGMSVLEAGGSALDAVEAACRVVEADLAESSVGRAGVPNALGEVRLDAQIMDGETLQAGSVGAVRNCCHVITLARHVMEGTPHVMIVGDGAEHLARELGLDDAHPGGATPLLTPDADALWRAALRKQFGDDIDLDDPTAAWRGSADERYPPLREWAELLRPRPVLPEHWFGTVNFMATDQQGRIATGVSTSGWGWSYPGRLGDTPVIGAGSYADSRYGAAAATGTGEVTIRTAAARSVVLYMKIGMSVQSAVREAMADMRDLRDPYVAHINLIAMDAEGNHAGCSYRPDKMYCVMRSGETEITMLPHENPHPWHKGAKGWLLYKHQKGSGGGGGFATRSDDNTPTARL